MADIRSKPATPKYRDWYDETFGEKPLPKGGMKHYSLNDLKEEEKSNDSSTNV